MASEGEPVAPPSAAQEETAPPAAEEQAAAPAVDAGEHPGEAPAETTKRTAANGEAEGIEPVTAMEVGDAEAAEAKKDAEETKVAEAKGDDEARPKEREHDRDRKRDRKDRHRDRSRSRERKHKHRERSPSKERSRSRSRKDRRRSRSRSKDRRRRRERSHSRSRSYDRRKRSRDRRSKSRDRRRSRSRDRRRRRRSSDEESDGYGGYVPRKRADSRRGFPDFPKPLMGMTQMPTNPEELQRKMLEDQLRARLMVLQQQAASAQAAASKTQRELYVGNLVGGSVTEDALRSLFNNTMLAAFPGKVIPGLDPVVNCSMHSEGRYAFVELRTPEMATASLQLNGVTLLGTMISVGRPSGYVDPFKATQAMETAALALAQFQETQLKKDGVLCQSDGSARSATAILTVDNMVLRQTLLDEHLYNEVITELRDECARHGTVLRVHVPRPFDLSQVDALFGTEQYGRAFVQFMDPEAATGAKGVLHGRLFDGQTLQVAYCHPTFFLEVVGLPQPEPVPGAAPPPGLPGMVAPPPAM